MNTFNNKTGVLLITAIMAVVATALFVMVPVTPTFIIAYMFIMLAIVMFCAGNVYMLNNTQSYPWLVAFPKKIWQYLMAQLVLSATFVVRDVFFTGRFHVGLFLFLHILLLGIFSVKLILIKSGKEVIEERDAEVKQKVSVIRLMQADVESIMRHHPEHAKPLRGVIEALKYSDPMSHPSAAFYEEQMNRSISAMSGLAGNDPALIPEVCENLLKQIADRNSRVKLMK